MKSFEEYSDKYNCARLERHNGILQVTLHTNSRYLAWDEGPHRELPHLFTDIGDDPDNLVVIITGTGDSFIGHHSGPYSALWLKPPPNTTKKWSKQLLWDKLYWEGKRLLTNLLDIEVPIICAVNGQARVHSEVALLCDIVLAREDTVFQDNHFPGGLPPGDGVHVIYPLLLGLNRARYFFLTGQEISAQEALNLGLVNEVLRGDLLLPRAWELAEQLAQQPILNLRYTKIALTLQLKRHHHEMLGYGLQLEGLAAIEKENMAEERLQ